ncbi:MAG: hypothetical protein KME43_22325 [Myxacorys chilensis ATA2-1-KO14]|jgi:hypothetical protein|nr:hypothetical protein [Myxacorys chilensis ATA2-1-KO14]
MTDNEIDTSNITPLTEEFFRGVFLKGNVEDACFIIGYHRGSGCSETLMWF